MKSKFSIATPLLVSLLFGCSTDPKVNFYKNQERVFLNPKCSPTYYQEGLDEYYLRCATHVSDDCDSREFKEKYGDGPMISLMCYTYAGKICVQMAHVVEKDAIERCEKGK